MSSIYIHLPFCQRRCPYCDFYSNEYLQKNIPEKEYLLALKQNINWWSEHYQIQPASKIYFGGGTPSLLDSDFYGQTIQALSQTFGIENNAEISIEVNPESVSKKWIKEIKNFGFNRITIGVQSFSNKLLRVVGRNYDYETALKSVAECQECFENVGIDLMFGIPTETRYDVEEDLRFAMTVNPKHISYYSLTVETMNGIWNGHKALSDDEIIDQFRIVRSILNKSGWIQYEISNYAKQGFECKHHLNCWNYGEYVGIGSGAVSFKINSKKPFIARRWKTTIDIDKYLKGSLETSEDDMIDIKSAMNEFVMLGLRMNRGLSINEFNKLFCQKFDNVYKNTKRFIVENYMKSNSDYVFLTEYGQEVSNQIIREMLLD